MSYSIEWEGDSFSELNKLEKDIAKRILDKVEEACENPAHFIERLANMSESKIRVGDYRVILFIDNTTKKFKIQAVGHRKNIYKRYNVE